MVNSDDKLPEGTQEYAGFFPTKNTLLGPKNNVPWKATLSISALQLSGFWPPSDGGHARCQIQPPDGWGRWNLEFCWECVMSYLKFMDESNRKIHTLDTNHTRKRWNLERFFGNSLKKHHLQKGHFTYKSFKRPTNRHPPLHHVFMSGLPSCANG